jgi:hypothetical protein
VICDQDAGTLWLKVRKKDVTYSRYRAIATVRTRSRSIRLLHLLPAGQYDSNSLLEPLLCEAEWCLLLGRMIDAGKVHIPRTKNARSLLVSNSKKERIQGDCEWRDDRQPDCSTAFCGPNIGVSLSLYGGHKTIAILPAEF